MSERPFSNITNMPHPESSSSLRLEEDPPVGREEALPTGTSSRGQEQNNHPTSTHSMSVNNNATAKGYLQQRQRLRKLQYNKHQISSPMAETDHHPNESTGSSRTNKLVRSDSNSSMDVSLSSLESSSSIRRCRTPIVG
eukprot:scaffold86736_cov37-Attheya_sp.AAC.1